MIIINREFNPTMSPASSDGEPSDETDWLEWDRWQVAEEYQDLLDGLSNIEDCGIGGAPKTFKDGEWDGDVARQLHRQGLEVEG